MKGIISIFVLPQELEDLALTLEKLKRNSAFIDETIQYKIDITMCLSDELTDWENSKLPKEYIKERTIELVEQYLDWCLWDLQWDNPNILGCVSQRRFSLKNNPDAVNTANAKNNTAVAANKNPKNTKTKSSRVFRS
jgi:hypothetical protein